MNVELDIELERDEVMYCLLDVACNVSVSLSVFILEQLTDFGRIME